MSDYAELDILIHCFYHPMGVINGHPILNVSWPLTPMPQPIIQEIYNGITFNLGGTNTVLIRDNDLNIVFDPGIIQLGRYGTLVKRLAQFGLKPNDIDIIINSHCHYDHIEANYLFKDKPLIIHEKELEHCDRTYWPEWTQAFIGIMEIEKMKSSKKITNNIEIVETLGHTPGSITALVKTQTGLEAIMGDAVIIKEDYMELKAPSVVVSNTDVFQAIDSMKKIAKKSPSVVIPGHDAPFSP